MYYNVHTFCICLYHDHVHVCSTCTILSLCSRSLILSFRDVCRVPISKSFFANSAFNDPFANSNITLLSLTCTKYIAYCNIIVSTRNIAQRYLHIITFSHSSCSLFCLVSIAQSWDCNLTIWVKGTVRVQDLYTAHTFHNLAYHTTSFEAHVFTPSTCAMISLLQGCQSISGLELQVSELITNCLISI